MKDKNQRVVSFRVQPELRAAAEAEATKSGLRLSDVLRSALKRGLLNNQEGENYERSNRSRGAI